MAPSFGPSASTARPHRLARYLYLRHYEPSPADGSIAFAALVQHGQTANHLFLIPSGGGKPRPVGKEAVAEGPAWTPDGRWLTFATPQGAIQRIHPDGTGLETIAEFPGEEIRGLLWSPNGRFLLFSAKPNPDEYND